MNFIKLQCHTKTLLGEDLFLSDDEEEDIVIK